ncbi:MAG: hypothetical protein U0136_07055 [Bdellovibrionota bacterium]
MPDNAQQKKQILGRPQQAVFRFAAELRETCRAELQNVLSSPASPEKFKPVLSADDPELRVENLSFRALMELTYRLRTFRDILWIVGQGRAGSVAEIRSRTTKVPWGLLLAPGRSIKLRVHSERSRVKHEGLLEVTVREILVEQGYSVVSGTDFEQKLDVRLVHNQLQLALSLSGETLSHRHYKTMLTGAAPIKEDLAAALIKQTADWTKAGSPSLVYVPFAGTGTLGFESVLYFQNLWPSVFRMDYALDKLTCTPAATRAHLQKCAAQATSADTLPVHFVEKSPSTAQVLRQNCAHFEKRLNERCAAHPARLSCEAGDFFRASLPERPGQHVFVPLNPPFGDRLGERSSNTKLYRRICARVLELAETNRSTRVSGFILAPTIAEADVSERSLEKFRTLRAPIRHGGRRIFSISFDSAGYTD